MTTTSEDGSKNEDAKLSAAPITVLVVDDEKNIRRTLGMVLDGDGYKVLEAESGEQALELLAQAGRPIDLAILDLKLPGIGGHPGARAPARRRSDA